MASINVAETQTHLTRRRVKSNDTMRSESASWRVGRRSRPLQRRPSQVPLAHTPSASANTAKRQLDGRRDWRRLAVSGQSSRHVFWNKSGTRRSRHSHLPSISSPFFFVSPAILPLRKKRHPSYTSLPRKTGWQLCGRRLYAGPGATLSANSSVLSSREASKHPTAPFGAPFNARPGLHSGPLMFRARKAGPGNFNGEKCGSIKPGVTSFPRKTPDSFRGAQGLLGCIILSHIVSFFLLCSR